MIEWFDNLRQKPFVQNVIHTILTRGVLIAIGLITSMLVTRGLGPTGKGIYSLVLAAIGIGAQFGNLGLHVSNTYFVAQNKRLLGFLFKNTIVLSLLTGLLITFFIYIVHLYRPNIFGINTALFPIIFLGIIFSLLSLLLRNLMIGIQKIKVNNYIELFTKVIVTSIIVILYFADKITVEYVLILVVLEFIIWSIYLGYKLNLYASPKGSISTKLFKKNFNYGFKAYIIGLLGYLVIRSDVFLVNYYLDKSNVGFYFTSVQLVDQIKVLGGIVASILMPKLSSVNSIKEKYRLNKEVIKYMSGILFVICLFAFILAEYIIYILFGEEFLPAVSSFRILLVAILFLSIESIMAQFLAATGLPKELIYYWILAFLINLSLNFYLIPIYGENGAAFASLVAYLIMLLLVAMKVRKTYLNESK